MRLSLRVIAYRLPIVDIISGYLKAHRWLSGIAVFFIAGVVAVPATAQSLHRVLILDQGDFTRPYRIAHTMAIRAALTNDPAQQIETYTEGLDIDRFPGDDHKKKLIGWLLNKYRDRPIDAIITEGPDALDFAIKFRAKFGKEIPIVFTAIEQYYVGRMAIPPKVTGVASVTSLKDLVEQAVRIVPNTKRIAILGDEGSEGSYLVDISREFVEIQMKRELNVMTGMPVTTLLSRVSSLPKDTVIIYLGISTDSTGQYFVPAELLSTIAKSANRPIFVTTDSLMESGALGGLIVNSADNTHEVADMIRRILNGEDASTIPILYSDTRKPIYDYKLMRKWGIPLNRLPAGSEILNRELTLWEQYSTQIVIIVIVIVLQTTLIAALIIEYRRRRKAELRFRRSMSDFAHLGRTTALGELSASIAHELNQPLAAILSNAEAAEVLIETTPLPLAEIKDAIADIRRDDQRASDIIVSMRSLFKKSEFEIKAVDINAVIDETVRFAAWEARSKSVEVVVEQEKNLPRVSGDDIQLKQVMLNLLTNGIEAVQGNGDKERTVKIISRLNDSKTVHVCVEDTGHGIPPELIEHIFDPYYSTKVHGMGMGLSISRTIIEAHGSQLQVENIPGGGARFGFGLAKAKSR